MTRKLLTGSAAAIALAFCAFPASAQLDDDRDAPLPIHVAAQGGGAQGGGAQGAAAAPAPIAWDQKRLERLERNLRRVENELARLQPNKAPPQLVEPDPEVTALQGRVDDLTQRVQDLEGALKRVNGSLDTLGLAVDGLKKDDEAAHAAADALTARVAALETQLKALTPPPPPAAPGGAAGAGGAAAGVDPGQAFQAAVQQMRDGDFAGAAKAFEAYISTWPDAPNAPEAHYRLAEADYANGDQAPAAEEYATSLKGWPKTEWAPDATVKLGMALQNLGRSPEACAAVSEFRKRYAASAPETVKARAQALEAKAQCKPTSAAPPAHHRRSHAD